MTYDGGPEAYSVLLNLQFNNNSNTKLSGRAPVVRGGGWPGRDPWFKLSSVSKIILDVSHRT